MLFRKGAKNYITSPKIPSPVLGLVCEAVPLFPDWGLVWGAAEFVLFLQLDWISSLLLGNTSIYLQGQTATSRISKWAESKETNQWLVAQDKAGPGLNVSMCRILPVSDDLSVSLQSFISGFLRGKLHKGLSSSSSAVCDDGDPILHYIQTWKRQTDWILLLSVSIPCPSVHLSTS